MSKALQRAPELPPAIAPDTLDVARLLLGAGRGQTSATKLTLVDAALILLGRVREDLAPAKVEAPAGGRRRRRRTKVARVEAEPPKPPEEAPAPAPRPERGGAGEEPEPEVFDHNGVTVTVGQRSASVEHANAVIEVQPRAGRLVACLARAMPHPVDRKFIAGRIWAGTRIPEASDTAISNLMEPIKQPLAELGLVLKTVRGVGIALQKAEGE
jgi:DNA-binding response OmpR family regulator